MTNTNLIVPPENIRPVFWQDNHCEESMNKLRARAISFAHECQFLGLMDTDHRRLEIPSFLSEDGFMKTLSEERFRHIFLETPSFMQVLVDAYTDDEIDENAFINIYDFFIDCIHLNPEDEIVSIRQEAEIIKLAKKHNIRVHCIDNIGLGGYDPEYLDKGQDILKRQLRLVIDMCKTDPSILCSQDALKIANTAAIQKILSNMNLSEMLEMVDMYEWTEEEGKPKTENELINWRLKFGDPIVAKNIKEITGSDRALILYGGAHFKRAFGDLDYFLGDLKCYNIEILANYDEQRGNQGRAVQPDIKDSRKIKNEEAPQASICLATQTWIMPDGTFESFGVNGGPQSLQGYNLSRLKVNNASQMQEAYSAAVSYMPLP